MDKECDVLIIGAGPGGCSAAFHMARSGFRTLVAEKAVFPREKICGDGIAPRAVHALYSMGLKESLEGRFQVIKGVRFFSTHGGVTEALYPQRGNFPDHGYIIPRIQLDQMLLSLIKGLGVEVWEGCEVLSILPPEKGKVPGVLARHQGGVVTIGARYIIGADGSSSRVGKDLGLMRQDPRYLGISVRCYMRGVKGLADFLQIFPEDAIMPCCGWIFPVEEGFANVGVGGMLYALKKKRVNLKRLFSDFCTNTIHGAKMLRDAKPASPLRGAQLRVGLEGSLPGKGNVLLVGDAASMTNPISGEGISYALESGRWAAEAVLAALADPERNPAVEYAQNLQQRYAEYFRQGWLCIRWGNNPWVINPLIWITSHNKRLGNKMGRYLMNIRRGDRPA
jgi:geranylgeranyl reductase family protein